MKHPEELYAVLSDESEALFDPNVDVFWTMASAEECAAERNDCGKWGAKDWFVTVYSCDSGGTP